MLNQVTSRQRSDIAEDILGKCRLLIHWHVGKLTSPGGLWHGKIVISHSHMIDHLPLQ